MNAMVTAVAPAATTKDSQAIDLTGRAPILPRHSRHIPVNSVSLDSADGGG